LKLALTKGEVIKNMLLVMLNMGRTQLLEFYVLRGGGGEGVLWGEYHNIIVSAQPYDA
jgi:hypothetical protein